MRVFLTQRSALSTSVPISGHAGARVLSSIGNISTLRPSKNSSFRVGFCRHCRGFTLVEVLVTLVIATVLIMIAVPNFKTLILSNKLTTVANDVVAAVNTARMEAIKRNASTQLCSDDAAQNTSDPLGSACSTASGTGTPVAGSVVTLVKGQPFLLLAGTPGIVMPIQLHGTVTAVRFNAQGVGQQPNAASPVAQNVIDICTSSMSQANHRIVALAAGGSIVSTSTPTATASCP